MPKSTITANNLKLLTELMLFEELAYKKCSAYAQTFSDTALCSTAKTLAANHKARYSSLLNYLNEE